jgi:hypothetical protein
MGTPGNIWKHGERYGTNGDFMRFNDESPQLQIGLYSFMHLTTHIYISTINLALTSAYWTATSLTNALELDAQHVVGSKPGVHAY